ncbi:MAG: thiopurine S-methyltransferase [Oligoflexia bacterium]|nr:thiopurine S-methyltransferase [Oligoflexia bacterium]
MEHSRWIEAWKDGRIGFHNPQYNQLLVDHYEAMNLKGTEKILVPLAGKSLDIIYLANKGHKVHAVELSELAIKDFFNENSIEFEASEDENFKIYRAKNGLNITFFQGDFFKYDQKDIDIIYDRASIVALPLEMRIDYRKHCCDLLKKDAQWFLITFEYDQMKMDGPPFSVTPDEISEDTQLINWNELSREKRTPSERFQEAGLDIIFQTLILGKKQK